MKKFEFIIALIFLLLVLDPLVSAEETELKELEITIPTEINENEEFNVTIMSNGTPVNNAIIIYNNSINEIIKTTDLYGKVELTSPFVTSNSEIIGLTIFVAKNGYIANETMINITNLPNLIFKDKEEYGGYQAEPNESILITIIDNFGEPVENVKIEISDYYNVIITYYTNKNGEVTIVAPNVQYHEDYYLIASKSGYSITEQYLEIYTPYADYSLLGIYVICPIIFFVIIAVIIIIVMYFVVPRKKREGKKPGDGVDKK